MKRWTSGPRERERVHSSMQWNENASAASHQGPPHLELADIAVNFDDFALGPVSLCLSPATIVCLLGPNGSGKSTLLRTVLGMQKADAGTARWKGEALARRPPSVFAEIGYVSDSAEDTIPELTPEEYWEYCALAYARTGRRKVGDMMIRARKLAKRLDFSVPRRPISSHSLGMCRKAQLVGGLMHQPQLLILDEPQIGLDFLSVRALHALLREERDAGALIILSSHDLGSAGRLADRIAVLHLGALIVDASLGSADDRLGLEDEVEKALNGSREEPS